MNTLESLVRSVVENKRDDTPVAALADALMENNDGRGLILAHWLRLGGTEYDDSVRPRAEFVQAKGKEPPEHWNRVSALSFGPYKPEAYINTFIGRGEHGGPTWRMEAQVGGNIKFFTVPMTHEEARQVADTVPKSAEFHEYLTNRFGKDPRPPYTAKYAAAINKQPLSTL